MKRTVFFISKYKDIPGFAKVVSNEEILENDTTFNISQYVSRLEVKDEMPKLSFFELMEQWRTNRDNLYNKIASLLKG